MIRLRRHRLGRDERGITIVEFAILAPVLILLITGAIEYGHILSARTHLEGAVIEAARTALVDMTKTEAQRETAFRTRVTTIMSAYPTEPGRSLSLETKVYGDFSSLYPEVFTDTNHNGVWDSSPAEPLVDRNGNGIWDASTPKTGTMGGVGDVVSYTATFPSALWFPFLKPLLGASNGYVIKATTVVRNEPIVRKST